ncbi:PREDICTED: NADH-cytochrome b5 reductase-like [Bactrocera latifrons]|uniref:NADH-cytochrome b5 reductase-like n=1 Tax=Bactrocera latifrons TaxID=174628 RepID=A0A0K8V1K6_BACLA|nr:PREDICTED: NADH-cytochrome b5 reductase-like [Bactrocera latifrons]
MDQTAFMSESECCGNGCINCVLNVGYRKTSCNNIEGKQNVISEYRKFRLSSKYPHNPMCREDDNGNGVEVFELHFCVADLPDGMEDFALMIPTGYHVMMRQYLATGLVCLRPYSPFWVDTLAMEFKILVNLAPCGQMSRYIKTLKVGDFVEFRGPIGAYEYFSNMKTERNVFIITQGVAIAATIRIVEDILNNEEDFSHVFQVACYKDIEHTFFRDALRDFNKYWNYKSHIYLAHQKCMHRKCKTAECSGECTWFQKQLRYKEKVHLRRFTNSELNDISKEIVGNSTESVFIIAGSNNFQESVTNDIKKLTLESSNTKIVLL